MPFTLIIINFTNYPCNFVVFINQYFSYSYLPLPNYYYQIESQKDFRIYLPMAHSERQNIKERDC